MGVVFVTSTPYDSYSTKRYSNSKGSYNQNRKTWGRTSSGDSATKEENSTEAVTGGEKIPSRPHCPLETHASYNTCQAKSPQHDEQHNQHPYYTETEETTTVREHT